MSDGGAIVNRVTCIRAGERVTAEIIVSHDAAEIGGWTYRLEELTAALASGEARPVEARHEDQVMPVLVEQRSQAIVIGGWSYRRAELLFALHLPDEHAAPSNT